MNVLIFQGTVWAIRLTANGSWYRNIATFPEAIDKNGNPKLDHPSVLKYVKEHT